MSKGMERLESLQQLARQAGRSGCVEVRLVQECSSLREDVVRASRELSAIGLAGAAADYREVAYLLDLLQKDLMNYEFAELEQRLCDLESRMRSVESQPGL